MVRYLIIIMASFQQWCDIDGCTHTYLKDVDIFLVFCYMKQYHILIYNAVACIWIFLVNPDWENNANNLVSKMIMFSELLLILVLSLLLLHQAQLRIVFGNIRLLERSPRPFVDTYPKRRSPVQCILSHLC